MNNVASVNSINSSIHSSVGLQTLLDEPQRLSSEAERLNEELESLVMDNYKVFVENLTCSVHLRLEDKKLGEISSELEHNLNELSQQCINFKDRVNQFVNLHKRNRKTLQHHMQLVELLEVPQLVDSCARNGLHDEALELANFVNGLERRHLLATEVNSLSYHHSAAANTDSFRNSGNDVIQTIVDDVHHTLAGLRQQLLQQLTENTALPKEISILATLRKLDSLLIDRHLSLSLDSTSLNSNLDLNKDSVTLQQYRDQLRQLFSQNSEIRLQMDFLEARTLWLSRNAERYLNNSNGIINSSSSTSTSINLQTTTSDQVDHDVMSGNIKSFEHKNTSNLGSYGKVIELLEIRRTAWFTVITQFNALFRDNETTFHSNTDKNTHKNNKNVDNNSLQESFSCVSFSPIIVLNTWLTNQVHQLLHEMKHFLPTIDDGASLRSILEQSLFFASRMRQVSCDFSNLIIPIFHEVMYNHVKHELQQAIQKFKNILLTERISFENDKNMLTKEQLIPIYSAQDPSQNTDSTNSTEESYLSHISAPLLSATTATSSHVIELSTPALLLHYPPLAYLLNIFLTQMNYIRECPLVTLEQPLLTLIFDLFKDICMYIINNSIEIHKIGEKYYNEKHFKHINKDKTKTNDQKNQIIWSMEHLYSEAIALELIPHILLCVDSIFNSNIDKMKNKLNLLEKKKLNTIGSRSQFNHIHDNDIIKDMNDNNETMKKLKTNNNLSFSYIIKNLLEAKDLFDIDIIDELENIYNILIKVNLLNNNVLKKEFNNIVTPIANITSINNSNIKPSITLNETNND